jgi:predicted CXXCH cytochrome family protein
MRRKPSYAASLSILFALMVFSLVLCPLASAAEPACMKCHAKLTTGKSVHKALSLGCLTCHSGIDASAVPHKKRTALEKGLSSEQPGLCYGCHDQAIFTKKVVHPAIDMGCTGCHNPHSSAYSKLLKSEPRILCYSCHEKAQFTKKNVHSPVASGGCMSCHNPHSSDDMALLLKKPIDVCLQCHPDTPHGRHVSTPQQPTNNQEKAKTEETEPQDPSRPGKPFYCGSCHSPHSTDSPLLFRFNAQSISELCKNCHKMN